MAKVYGLNYAGFVVPAVVGASHGSGSILVPPDIASRLVEPLDHAVRTAQQERRLLM